MGKKKQKSKLSKHQLDAFRQRLIEKMREILGDVNAMEESALQVPYSNLATMARHLGKNDEAERYLLEAKKHKDSAVR